MSKSAPVNLFAIGAERFPIGAETLEAMSFLAATYDKLWPALHKITAHIGETSMGIGHDGVPIPDDEMAFHHLAATQIDATIDELSRKCTQLLEISKERMWNTVTNRRSLGMIALGKMFELGGGVIPKPPKEGTPEYIELMGWIRANGYGEHIYPEGVGFKGMQAICDGQTEKKQPRPPHVTTSPQKTVSVKKL